MSKKRLLSAVLVLSVMTLILFAGLPVYAAGSNPATYTFDISEGNITVANGSGSNIKVTYGASQTTTADFANTQEITIIGSSTTNFVNVNITGNTAKITLDNADIEPASGCAFSIDNGTVNLTVTGANTLKSTGAYPGLSVGLGKTLTVQGTGSLNATGGGGDYGGAGIGGGDNSAGGTITINSGTITTTGGGRYGGAGIGGGYNGDGGTITINGGTITATGGGLWGGAGIGGGFNGAGGTIMIKGGLVTAISGGDSGWSYSGIGAGYGGSGGTITILNGASVTAVSYDYDSDAIGSLQAGSTAYVLMAKFIDFVNSSKATAVYKKSDSSLIASYTPSLKYCSIAFTVPSADTYQLKTSNVLQRQGNIPSSDFTITGTGLTTFTNVMMDLVGEDKAALVAADILGTNADLDHIVGPLTNPLPNMGSVYGSFIAWSSDTPSVVSDDGQTVVRPAYGVGNATVHMTATIAFNAASDTKTFTLTVLQNTHDFNISEGDITITAGTNAGTLKVAYGAGLVVDNIAPATEITIKGTSATNHVVVDIPGQKANITLDGADIEPAAGCPFSIDNGTVNLTVTGSNTLKGTNDNPGLYAAAGNTLTIQGTGSLNATGGNNASGIGGGDSASGGGTITVNSGQVTATGGSNGAGIGGGPWGSGGTFTINGGTITAIGGSNGAGIGGGPWGSGGTIKINGGTITAIGGSSGSGIGDGAMSSIGGTISINAGANVTAISNGLLPAIDAVGGSLEAGSTAYVLEANFAATKNSGTATAVYLKSDSSLIKSYTPTINYKSITFIVPAADIYQLKTAGNLQMQGSACKTDFNVSGAGVAAFDSVADYNADKAAVGAAKSSIAGGTYINLAIDDLTSQTQKTAAVQAVVDTLKGTTTATVFYDRFADNYYVSIIGGTANDYTSVSATFTKSAAGALADAKTAAHAELTNSLAGYTQTDYSADNWTALTTAKTAGDTNLDNATDTNGVTIAKDNAIAAMAAVQTIVQQNTASVAADKAALSDSDIQGSNTDMSHITVALTKPLPSTGTNGSTITWSSDTPSVVSNDGQTVVRPYYGAGNATVTVTATITKGAVTDTKAFTLIVLQSSYSGGGGGGGYIPPSSTNTTQINTTETEQTTQTEKIIGSITQPANKNQPNTSADVVGSVTQTNNNNQTITTVTVDDEKLNETISNLTNTDNNTPTVVIPVATPSDVVVGQLNGQTVKNMENKEATIEIKTENASYSLPAAQINIDAVSNQLGTQVALKDIIVQVQISKSNDDTVKVVENAASKNSLQIIAPPVNFNITCIYNNRSVEVSQFNSYVERNLAIPEGVDASKITTGVIVDPNGTIRQVPTRVTIIGGKYYAKINSLTNSTYTLIWHPVEFKDVANHWAKDAVNDMGSRLIVSGIGNGTYEPDRDITRAEFAAIVIRALGLKPGIGDKTFSDVNDAQWYSGYIKTAYEYNIISGYNENKFGPLDKITREQAMSMIARAMKVTKLNVDLKAGEAEQLLAKFTDSDKSSGYAKNNIAECIKNGVVSGKSGNRIAPKDYITRAEVAAIVQRLLQKSNLI